MAKQRKHLTIRQYIDAQIVARYQNEIGENPNYTIYDAMVQLCIDCTDYHEKGERKNPAMRTVRTPDEKIWYTPPIDAVWPTFKGMYPTQAVSIVNLLITSKHWTDGVPDCMLKF
jgi:hypothetical protein